MTGGLAGRLTAPARFARMAGSTIAAPDAAPWVTDFINAAYHRRPAAAREVADLRLAWGVLATRWHHLGGRRLHLHDLAPVVRAFGVRRFRLRRHAWGTLEPGEVLEGAGRLLGDWFPEAWGDDGRRAYGIAFPDTAARRRFRPESRLELAPLRPPSPPSAPEAARNWHTYDPVRVPRGAAAVAAALSRAESWPDWASPLARFTALRGGPAGPGQTFEIDVLAEPVRGLPVLSRGYVSVTRVLGPGAALDEEVEHLAARLGESPVPAGGTPGVLVELTTHEGHFLGRAVSRLLAYDHDGSGWVRDIGCWDPLPLHLAATYRLAGREAQDRLWGPHDPDASMLAQLAGWIAARPGLH